MTPAADILFRAGCGSYLGSGIIDCLFGSANLSQFAYLYSLMSLIGVTSVRSIAYVQKRIEQPPPWPRRGKLQIGAMVIGEGFSRSRSLSSIIHVIEMRLT
jgi:hypothetical protein